MDLENTGEALLDSLMKAAAPETVMKGELQDMVEMGEEHDDGFTAAAAAAAAQWRRRNLARRLKCTDALIMAACFRAEQRRLQ